MGTANQCVPVSELATRTPRNLFLRNFDWENYPPFGRVCVALWGREKPGSFLAERIGKTKRIADLYIEGKTPPSYEALMAVLDECRPRRK